MERKLPILVGAAVCALLAAALLMKHQGTRHGSQSCFRVRVDPKQQTDGQSPFSWTWFCMQSDGVSNYFRLPATMQALSERTGIKANDFCFAESPVLRGAALVEVHFYAESSNKAWRVGRAAKDEMFSYYRTNQPYVDIVLIDAVGAGRRRPIWREALDWVRDLTPW